MRADQKRSEYVRRRIGSTVVLCAVLGILALVPTQASAFRYFQTEVTEVPGGEAVPGPFGFANKVAADSSNNVWLLDAPSSFPYSGKGVVDKFDSSGGFLFQATGEGGWYPDGSRLEGVAFSNSANSIFIADKKNGDIWKLNDNGVVQGSIGGPGSPWAVGEYECCDLRVDVDNTGGPGDGNIYVSAATCCSREEQGVYRISASGQPVPFTTSDENVEGNHLLGETKKRDDAFGSAVGVAIAADGDIWVASDARGFNGSALFRFDSTGKFLEKFTSFPTPEGTANLQDIVIDPTNGHIILSSGGGFEGGGYVWEYTADGTFIEPVESPSGFTNPNGLAVGPNGDLYVGDGQSLKIFGRDFPLPGITYEPVTDRTQTSGTLHAEIDPNGGGPVTSCEVEYGTDTSYGLSVPCAPDPGASPPGSNFTSVTEVSAELTGLTPEQPYHYRFVASNADVTRRGQDQVYTPHWVEALETMPATDLTPNSAVLNGAFQGNGKATTFHFEWGKTDEYGSSTPEQSAGSPTGAKSIQTTLAGLAPVTTYHFRAVATSSDGESKANDVSFTTPPLPPTVSTWVTDVHSDSVIFHAKVNPGGGDTSYHVEFVDDAHFQVEEFNGAAKVPTVDGKVGTGFREIEVSTKVAPLAPGTIYHYRVVATNSYKSTVSEARTFTTFEYGGELEDPCENAQVRQQTGAALLLDCRAYELVSAADTGGYDVVSDIVPGQVPFGGYPTAVNPSRALYSVHQGAIPGPWNPTNLGMDPYVATRNSNGWTTQYMGLPANGIPSAHPFASAFSGTDSRLGTFAFAGENLCAPCFADGKSGIPVRLPGGSIVQGMAGSEDPGPEAEADLLVRERLSADGRHLVFGSTAVFDEDAEPGAPNIYDRDLQTETTHVVSRLPDGQNIPCLSNCDSKGVAELDLSDDGSRVLIGQLVSTDAEGNDYWHLYMNVGDSSQGIDLMPGSSSGGLYDGMSADGTKVYFTTPDQLSDDSDSSADIYRADVDASSASLTRISVGDEGTGDTDSCSPALNNSRLHWNSAAGEANCDAVAIGGGGGVARSTGDIYFLSPELLDGAGNGVQDAPNLYLSSESGTPRYVTTLESSHVVPQPPPKGHPFRRSFGSLETPTGIAFDPAGNYVYVLEPGLFSGKVEKFDSQAHPVAFTAGSEAGSNSLTGADTPSGSLEEFGPLGLPNQLAVDQATGDFFVPNIFGGGVERFAGTGEFLSRIPAFFPTAVAVNQSNGQIYIASFFGTVNVFDSSGGFLSEFSTIESPTSVAVDSAGNVYVSNGAEAAVYDSSGTYVENLEVEVAKGLAVDPDDDHLYIDEGTRLRELDPSRAQVGPPLGEGLLSNSTGVAVDGGQVVASDMEAGKVFVWGPAAVLPNPLYDNPAVLNAIGDAETRHTADFQATSTGRFAAFSSKLPLTGYDNNGHVELFRYDASNGSIDCVSCAATGARATGDASLATRGLSLSEDGRVFFNSTDPLIPSDLNGAQDAFEWSNGEIGPISSGASPVDASLLSITADGTDAFFFTRETLARQDENGNSVKLYDARVDGGFLFDPPPEPCKASDECHGPGTQPAPPPNIGTYEGTRGNQIVTKKKKKRKHRKRRRHRGKKRGHHRKRGHQKNKRHHKGKGRHRNG